MHVRSVERRLFDVLSSLFGLLALKLSSVFQLCTTLLRGADGVCGQSGLHVGIALPVLLVLSFCIYPLTSLGRPA